MKSSAIRWPRKSERRVGRSCSSVRLKSGTSSPTAIAWSGFGIGKSGGGPEAIRTLLTLELEWRSKLTRAPGASGARSAGVEGGDGIALRGKLTGISPRKKVDSPAAPVTGVTIPFPGLLLT